jgi:hypothetical protein
MKKLVASAGAAAIAAVLGATALPAIAAAPAQILEDPLGDSNFVNDQGTGDGSNGDQTAADAGTVSDLLGVQLSNDKKNLTVTIQTEAAPPATTGIGYRVRFNPDGANGAYCIAVEAYFPGANNALTTPMAHLVDECNGGETTPLELLGTTIYVPRSANAAFAKGATLKAPQAQAFLYSGNETAGAEYPVADTTKVGTDYKLKK